MASLPILKPNSKTQDISLIEAARRGSASTIESILNKGIDINVSDANGITALIMASSAGNLEAVKILIENGAKKDLVDSLGYNAYASAMFYGDFRGVAKDPFNKIMELVKLSSND